MTDSISYKLIIHNIQIIGEVVPGCKKALGTTALVLRKSN